MFFDSILDVKGTLKKTSRFRQNSRILPDEFPTKLMTFADAEYASKRKQTRKELFLIKMDRVVPWKDLITLIEPHYTKVTAVVRPIR